LPTAKVNFVKVFVNGENYGLYVNVQQLNGSFFGDWFSDNDGTRWRAERPDTSTYKPPKGGGGGKPDPKMFGAGTSSLNYLGDDVLPYTAHYTLKSTSIKNPWLALIDACKNLDQVPSQYLYDSLKTYLDVDRALWHIATENIFADEDGYLNKGGMDYYVYHDLFTNRVIPIDYDGNSTFSDRSINQHPYIKENDELFPLINKLLQSNELKQRYTSHYRVILENYLNEEYVYPIIDNYYNLIKDTIKQEAKFIYTNQEFEADVLKLKEFITERREYLEKLPILNRDLPVIYNVNFESLNGENQSPKPNQTVSVSAEIESTNGISQVLLYYGVNIEGVFETILMSDDGEGNDKEAGDGIFTAEIPGYSQGTFVRFYIEARANDVENSSAFNPEGAEHDVYIYQVESDFNNSAPVVINEIMASNDNTIADPQGEYDDWIELYNLSENPVKLDSMYLSDKPTDITKWQFPENTTIEPYGYLIVWADEDGKAEEGLHANFKLSASGEQVYLYDTDENNNELWDMVDFQEQETDISFGRVPNGIGDFQQLEPSPNKNNESKGIEDKTNELNLKIYPNPVIDNFSVLIDIEKSQNYNIKLVDISGRVITELFDGLLLKGNRVLEFDLNSISKNVLNSGVIFIHVKANGIDMTKKLLYQNNK